MGSTQSGLRVRPIYRGKREAAFGERLHKRLNTVLKLALLRLAVTAVLRQPQQGIAQTVVRARLVGT